MNNRILYSILTATLISTNSYCMQDVIKRINTAATSHTVFSPETKKDLIRDIGNNPEVLDDPAIAKKFTEILTQWTTSLLLADKTKKYFGAIAVASLKASLVGVSLGALSAATGNIKPEELLVPLLTQLIYHSVEGLAKAGLEVPEKVDSPAALTTASVEIAKTLAKSKPITLWTAPKAAYTNIVAQALNQAIASQGGWGTILQGAVSNVSLFGPIKGPELPGSALPEKEGKPVIQGLEKLVPSLLSNDQAKRIIAAMILSGLQGAAIGIIAQSFGIGYWFEPTYTATALNSLLAGAAEGFINYMTFETRNVGLITDLMSSAAIYIPRAEMAKALFSPGAIISFGIQKVVSNTINQVIEKQGLSSIARSIGTAITKVSPSEFTLIPERAKAFISGTFSGVKTLASSLSGRLT